MTAPDASGAIPGLAAARLWAAARYPYLASGIFGARVVAAPGIRTVAVDQGWRLWADPELTAAWTAAELGSVLVHHVCHLLREHGPRAGLAGVRPDESRTWIRSADAEINDDLVPAGLTLPGDPVLPQHLGCPPGQLTEQYFTASRARTVRPAQPGANGGDGQLDAGELDWGGSGDLDCGSGADGFGRPWESGQPAVLPPWQARLLQRLVAQQVLAAKQAGDVPPACCAGQLTYSRPRSTGAGPWRLSFAKRSPTLRARSTTATAGRPAARRPPAMSCCRHCAGRCPMSPWCATPRAACRTTCWRPASPRSKGCWVHLASPAACVYWHVTPRWGRPSESVLPGRLNSLAAAAQTWGPASLPPLRFGPGLLSSSCSPTATHPGRAAHRAAARSWSACSATRRPALQTGPVPSGCQTSQMSGGSARLRRPERMTPARPRPQAQGQPGGPR